MNLRAKLAAIRDEIHNVEKRGKNTFHKYDYAMASDVAGLLGNALARAGIVTARRNLQVKRYVPEGGKEVVVELTCEYGFLDADSDEQLWQPAFGEGRDTGDKAAYKAFTGALKYFLVQAFLLATGDDPEADDEPAPKRDERPAAAPKPATPLQGDVQAEIAEIEALCKRISAEEIDPAKVLAFFKKSDFDHFTKSEVERAHQMIDNRKKS